MCIRDSLEDRDRSSNEVASQLRRDLADIAGCEITVSASSMSVGEGSDISLQLTGEDYDQLAEAANDLAAEIEALPDAKMCIRDRCMSISARATKPG